MNENRRNGRRALKGFTLVEIIVVLVILAILAAAMIPALTGYIDKAKDRTIISEARNALTAAQTVASEAYGLGKTDFVDATSKKVADTYVKEIKKLAEVNGTISDITVNAKNKITGLKYTNKEGTRYVEYKELTANSGVYEFDEVKDVTSTP
jgi:prepilin-type N-terminal cleavage/methylation domain-containing protein